MNMDIDITLKNYRCFEDSNPAKFTVGRSFVGFVGPNNSGKSSILRFFFEFRLFSARKTGALPPGGGEKLS